MKNNITCNSGGGTGCAIYGMALIGALVYFLKGAVTFSAIALAILKSLAWPAILIFHILKFLQL